jgi:hypothetical protein
LCKASGLPLVIGQYVNLGICCAVSKCECHVSCSMGTLPNVAMNTSRS